MEAKIRIVEISPKLKCFKNNPKDIISISFISDNYSVIIEDIEKAIISNDKIIINLKEIKQSKNKNIFQPIKYSLIRNNNNIITTGEFTPTEGVKWYNLNEIKNNMSKESLITSSTSNGNIKNNNINRRARNLSDSHNSYANEPMNNFYSKNNFNKLTNNSGLTILKIKFAINIINTNTNINVNKNNKNYNHYNSIKSNNYTKEPSENSSKYDEILFDKDIFNEEDFTIIESDISKLNPKSKISTTSKKFNNQKKISSGMQTNKFSKKKLNFILNQNQILKGGIDNPINAKTIITNTINNNRGLSPLTKANNTTTKKSLNEDIRMKTSIGFNKVKRLYEDKEINENKYITKRSSNSNDEIQRKMNSSKIIEDEILDQNFKNFIKNDEILKSNLSRNNSLNNLNQNNGLKDTNNQNDFITNNNDNLQQTDRSKMTFYNDNNKNNSQCNKKILPGLNVNSLYDDLQLLKTNNDNEYVISESISKNIITNNDNNSFEEISLDNNDNFEKLKNDFFLLYSNENLNKIKDDVLLLEIQYLIEKIIDLQKKHQKEYIDLFNSINIITNIYNSNQSKFLLLIKKLNKLKTKKLYHDIIDKKKEIYNEKINNFIKIRKKIMKKEEFKLWNKMIEYSNKSLIINNNKNKFVNIFLNICQKNENQLNKLSLKFYKEIKNKKNKKTATITSTSNVRKKKSKLINNFSAKKLENVKMRIKDNETEGNLPYLKTNQNMANNFRMITNKKKFMISKKNTTRINLNNDENNSINNKNNNMIFSTVISENKTTHINKKKKNYKNKSSSTGDKESHKKKGANKSQ